MTVYLKSEFNLIHRNLSETILQNLSKSIHQQLDNQTHIFYLLRLVLYESYLSQQKKKFDFTDLNLDDILNAYIGKVF